MSCSQQDSLHVELMLEKEVKRMQLRFHVPKLENLTWPEVEGYLGRRRDILIPVAATEEHGYHLPISTDVIIVEKIAEAVSKRTGILVAPTIKYGLCRLTAYYPGTVSISFETVKRLVSDIIESLREQGFERFVILTGHGGGAHVVALEEVARTFVRLGVEVCLANPYDLDFSDVVSKQDAHAGEVETSLLLYLDPRFVKPARVEGGELPERPGLYVPFRERPTASGVFGQPKLASAEKGRKIFERMVSTIVKFIESR